MTVILLRATQWTLADGVHQDQTAENEQSDRGSTLFDKKILFIKYL